MSGIECKHIRSGEADLITFANHLLCFVLVLVFSLSLQELEIVSTPKCSIHVRP